MKPVIPWAAANNRVVVVGVIALLPHYLENQIITESAPKALTTEQKH